VRRGVATRAAAAADVPADEGPSITKNLSLAFDSSCRVRPRIPHQQGCYTGCNASRVADVHHHGAHACIHTAGDRR